MYTQTETQFYPSTTEISELIYQKANIKGSMTVLDPMAGTGVLLDTVKEGNRRYDAARLFAIELDPNLRFVLTGKGHKVIGTDFLDYSDPLKFDRIIMNPAFNCGAQAVLKAYNSHLKEDGILVSILNAETLRNPCSSERQALARLIEQYGTQQDLGQAFKHAARPTDANVLIITLRKPKLEQSFSFAAASFSQNHVSAEEFKADPLAHTSVLMNLCAQYKACERSLIERHEMQSRLNFYLNGISDRVYAPDHRSNEIEIVNRQTLEEQITELKSRFWATVFNKTDFCKKATSGFKQKFTDYSQSQASMEFNISNIREMLEMFFMNREQIMKDSLLETFDKATGLHEKNRIHFEGWKTNKSYKLSKKIIHPYGVQWCSIMNYMEVSWQRESFLSDLDKVLCWLSGKSMDNPEFVGTHRAMKVHCDRRKDYDSVFYSTFFKIRVYKKGTVHLEFLDLKLLETFNKAVAQGKNWIGPDY